VDEEPTPQWEFHYTNRIYHGPGVPDPDIANLVGCDCVGKCDPKSKTCACVKRQRELIMFPEENMEAYNSGFLYDKQKRLKHTPYPIVECNALCGCDAECMNRVSGLYGFFFASRIFCWICLLTLLVFRWFSMDGRSL
jgi:histone-lysine N-methyltransferase SUV39H